MPVHEIKRFLVECTRALGYAHKHGIVIDARDRLRFEHRHPAFGKGKMDETYKELLEERDGGKDLI